MTTHLTLKVEIHEPQAGRASPIRSHSLSLSASHRSGRPSPPQLDFAYRLNVCIAASYLLFVFPPPFLTSFPHHVPSRDQNSPPRPRCRSPWPCKQTIDKHRSSRRQVEELEEHHCPSGVGRWSCILLQHE